MEKVKLLKRINEAFAKSDSSYLVKNVTDDIKWNIVGDRIIEGKEAFAEAVQQMESGSPLQLTINNIISHGKMATVDGTLHAENGPLYAFCDIYKFSGFKNPKINEMTSYVVEVKG